MEKNYICKINGVAYNLKDEYELLVQWGCGDEAQALIREKTGLKAIPAWRLAERIKSEGQVPVIFFGDTYKTMASGSIPARTTTESYWSSPKAKPKVKQKKRTEVFVEKVPQRKYTDNDYQRDLIIQQCGHGMRQTEAEIRIHEWEHGRDPYNKE